MGLKERKKMKFRQKLNRRKKRDKLIKKGLNPNDYYVGGYYVGKHKE